MAAAQQERKAKLDAGRVDTVFKVGDRVLLRTKELLNAADIGKLMPRWDGPFTVTACSSPNAYTLALPPRMQCSRTVNVDRLKPFHERFDAPPAPGQVSESVRPGAGGRALGGAAATQQQGEAGRHALPRAVARTHVSERRVAARGGARALQEKVAESTPRRHVGEPAVGATRARALRSSPRRMRCRPFLWPRRGLGWLPWPRLWLARRWWGGRSCTAGRGRARVGRVVTSRGAAPRA